MPIYRCSNCKGEAEHPTPGKCEPCGLDPKKDARDAQCLAELVTLHFDPPHRVVVGRGQGFAACNPKLKPGTGPRFTGERDHVNCPACRASEAFAAAADHTAMPAESITIGSLEEARRLAREAGE